MSALTALSDISSIFVPIVGVAITWMLGRNSIRNAQAAAQRAYEDKVRQWARDLADVFIDLRTAPGAEQHDRAATRLSVLIDYGRLYFPNDGRGAGVGYRSAVLDPLVEAYRRATKSESDGNRGYSDDWRNFCDSLGSHTESFAIGTSPEARGQRQYRGR